MTAVTITLKPLLQLTDEQFYLLCQVNPEAKLERTAAGELVVMSPTGGESGRRNTKLTQRLANWAEADGTGEAFDSSTMFQLPSGAYRSPDAAWILLSSWNALTPIQRQSFPPICPDFVVELRSDSDELRVLQDKMQEYIDNGARLGWLLDLQNKRLKFIAPDNQRKPNKIPSSCRVRTCCRGFC